MMPLIPLFFSVLLVMPQVTYPYTICSTTTTNYTVHSQFESNLKGLLSGSPYNDGDQSNLSTTVKTDDPDRVYGLFLCGVDVADSVCKYCIDSASDEIVKQYPLKKEAVIWYDQCLISYSNRPFFSDLSPMDCRNCLSDAVSAIPSCILGSWVRRFTPSCIVRYDLNRISQDPPLGATEAPSW